MDFDLKCRAWYDGLTTEQRCEALAIVGELPSWMVASLAAAGIPPIQVEMSDHDGRVSYLMPTRVLGFLEDAQRARSPERE